MLVRLIAQLVALVVLVGWAAPTTDVRSLDSSLLPVIVAESHQPPLYLTPVFGMGVFAWSDDRGLYRDASGQVKTDNRMYEPSRGVFTSPDPIGYAAKGNNLYSWCENEPVGRNDEQGTDWVAYDGNDAYYYHEQDSWWPGRQSSGRTKIGTRGQGDLIQLDEAFQKDGRTLVEIDLLNQHAAPMFSGDYKTQSHRLAAARVNIGLASGGQIPIHEGAFREDVEYARDRGTAAGMKVASGLAIAYGARYLPGTAAITATALAADMATEGAADIYNMTASGDPYIERSRGVVRQLAGDTVADVSHLLAGLATMQPAPALMAPMLTFRAAAPAASVSVGSEVVAGSSQVVTGAPIGIPNVASAAEYLSVLKSMQHTEVTANMARHVSSAANVVDSLGIAAFTIRQAAAVLRNPGLWQAFRGNRIDVMARQNILNDPTIRGQLPNLRDFYTRGADFVDVTTGRWWDMTTPSAWLDHVRRYGANGTLLPTR